MRTALGSLLAVSLLLGLPQRVGAADKIKIEIVEATTTIGLVPHTLPGTPEQIKTHCVTRVDVNCNSIVTPATDPTSTFLPEILLFKIKAIFPDGSHFELVCFPSRLNKKCGGIIPIAGSTTDSVNCFLNAMASPAAWASPPTSGATKTCTEKNLGSYQAKWDGDKLGLVIYEHGGKKEYRVAGSW